MSFAIEKEERFAAYNAQMCLASGRKVRQDLEAHFEAAQVSREGRNRETTDGLVRKPPPLLKCGLVAGIRHCQSVDAPDHIGRQMYFTDARKKAIGMVQTWISAGVRLGVNLGNLVDQRCAIQRKHDIALHSIKTTLCDDFKTGTWRFRLQEVHQENKFRADVLHLFGEHDLQHFSLPDLDDYFSLWKTVQNVNQSPSGPPESDCRYFSTNCPGGWKLIFLDTNDISTRSSLLSKRTEARKWLDTGRKPGQLPVVTNSGAVGKAQLQWLRGELAASRAQGERAILFSHSPLSEQVARQGGDPELICWNYKQVMSVIFSESGVVACCISGQQLNGGYGVDDMTRKGRGRIHHFGLRNAVTAPQDVECFGVLELFDDHIVVQGFGVVKSLKISCPTMAQAKAIVELEIAQAMLRDEEATSRRQQEGMEAKQAREAEIKRELEEAEAAALLVDAEERRLWRIAQEEEAKTREEEKLLEEQGKHERSEGESGPPGEGNIAKPTDNNSLAKDEEGKEKVNLEKEKDDRSHEMVDGN